MKSAIRQGIKSAFQQMGDLKKDTKLKHLTGREYDEATGKFENTYEEVSVEIFISSFDKAAVDGVTIHIDDLKILLPAYQINFTPKIEDDSLIIDGKTHGIEMVQNKFNELYVLKI